MSESLTLTMTDKAQAWNVIKSVAFPFLAGCFEGGKRWLLTIRPETRSEAQNRLMWPLLTVFSKSLQWPVDGQMVTMTTDDWKDVLSAAFNGESVRLAMGLNGGVVMLGQRTSKFTKPQFSEWIEFLYATAALRGITLPAWTASDY